MSGKSELTSLLQETEHIIQWSILNVPSERVTEIPPHAKHPQSDKGFKTYFGSWSALRLLFHLVFYEEHNAIPIMKLAIGGTVSPGDIVFPNAEVEEQAWQESLAANVDAASLLDKLHQLRTVQTQLISEIPDEKWQSEIITTELGSVSPDFVVSKTIQHSLEHANDLLKNALYWERALRWLDYQAG